MNLNDKSLKNIADAVKKVVEQPLPEKKEEVIDKTLVDAAISSGLNKRFIKEDLDENIKTHQMFRIKDEFKHLYPEYLHHTVHAHSQVFNMPGSHSHIEIAAHKYGEPGDHKPSIVPVHHLERDRLEESKIDPVEAREFLEKHGMRNADFHALGSEHIGHLIDAAKHHGYRKDPNASGSTARMFHKHLENLADRADAARHEKKNEDLDEGMGAFNHAINPHKDTVLPPEKKVEPKYVDDTLAGKIKKAIKKVFHEESDHYSKHEKHAYHGGPWDRGAADAYYGREKDPHKYPNGTYNGDKVKLTDPEEIKAYHHGYDTTSDRKDWGESVEYVNDIEQIDEKTDKTGE